jgi:hypothetical protein
VTEKISLVPIVGLGRVELRKYLDLREKEWEKSVYNSSWLHPQTAKIPSNEYIVWIETVPSWQGSCSMVECLPSMFRVLGSIPSMGRGKERKKLSLPDFSKYRTAHHRWRIREEQLWGWEELGSGPAPDLSVSNFSMSAVLLSCPLFSSPVISALPPRWG